MLRSRYGDSVKSACRKCISRPFIYFRYEQCRLHFKSLVFLFSALAIRAVARAAYYVISDVRARFRENPGILRGASRTDHARACAVVYLVFR